MKAKSGPSVAARRFSCHDLPASAATLRASRRPKLAIQRKSSRSQATNAMIIEPTTNECNSMVWADYNDDIERLAVPLLDAKPRLHGLHDRRCRSGAYRAHRDDRRTTRR